MIKQWILNRLFVQNEINSRVESVRAGERIKAFKFAHEDILETRQEDLTQGIEDGIKKKLNDLLSPIDLNSIVSLDKRYGIVYIGEQKSDDARLANLKSEAEYLLQTDLWKLLCETPKRLAEKAMFSDPGMVETQLLKGRAMLYLLDTQKTILDTFKKVVIKK